MELSKKQEELIGKFYYHLGDRFPVIEAASEGAPVTICAYDTENKEYYIYLDDKLENSIYQYDTTGIKIDNVHFYQLYGMASEGLNVFHMTLCVDGYALFYLNDCLTPEQLKVTEEFTLIGITSALHVELPKSETAPTLTGSYDAFSMN